MRNASLWRGVLGVEKTVVEELDFDPVEEVLVAHVRPRRHASRGAGCAGNDHCGMTTVRGDGDGGIDEISYKRHHKYLTVVVDHDSGRLVWAKPGRDKATLASFFDQLGPERSALISHVSADGAEWISTVVAKQCPQAVRCADPFHVVQWATEALDEVRRQAWNLARGAVTRRRAGRSTGHAKALKGARYALWKNPENLTGQQQAKLAWIAKTDPRLHRAYLLKEGLRLVFSLDSAGARRVGPVDRLGPPLPHRTVRAVAATDREAPGLDPGRRRTWPVQRPDRIGQHQDPTPHPVLLSDRGRRGKRWSDHRTMLEGIAWRYRVGARGGTCRWSSVPGSCRDRVAKSVRLGR